MTYTVWSIYVLHRVIPPNSPALLMIRHSKPVRFGTFNLVYKNADSVRLGDVVYGNVDLTLLRSLLVRRMTVVFYGEIEFETVNGQVKTVRFERQSQELWRKAHRSEAGALLRPGFYVYEFYVGTRFDLPGAFVGCNDEQPGVIRSLIYYVEVHIVESLRDQSVVVHIKRLPLCLRGNCIDAPNARRKGVVIGKNVVYVRNVLDPSGCIAATIVLNQRQCSPGKRLFFDVEVLNCFRKLDVRILLVQRAKIRRRTMKFETITHRLYTIKLGDVKSSQAYRRWTGEQLWIPDDRRVPVHVSHYFPDCQVILLDYTLLLTVTPLVGKTLTIELPLIIRRRFEHSLIRKHGIVISGAATI